MTMRLQDELDAVRRRCLESTPPRINRIRQDAINDLVLSRLAEQAVRAGDHAPDFRLRDADGNVVSFDDLPQSGPLVIVFYRGRWCPYCEADLQAIEAAAEELRARGASLVAISPQSAEESRATEQAYRLSFPSLVDRGGRVARAFGLRWKLSPELRAAELESGLDLAVVNGEASWTLAMPARYVIGPRGMVAYADVSADYTRRGEPGELLPVVNRMRTRVVH